MVKNQRNVSGITANLAQELHPQQWVNLYQLDPELGAERLHYCGKCQVKDLSYVFHGSPAKQFALEPLDCQGNVMSVHQAFKNAVSGDLCAVSI